MGIDLAGGSDLIFQVDTEKAQQEEKKITPQVMQRLIGAVTRRLDPAAQEQITVRQVGSDRIEVIIPGADREVVEQKKKQMTRLGTLEFAILANMRKHREIIRQAQASPDPVLRHEGQVVAAWREVGWRGKEQGPRPEAGLCRPGLGNRAARGRAQRAEGPRAVGRLRTARNAASRGST